MLARCSFQKKRKKILRITNESMFKQHEQHIIYPQRWIDYQLAELKRTACVKLDAGFR